MLTTARNLQGLQDLGGPQVDLYRAGIWKPRTRPGAFEGIGVAGLPWLRRVKEETGMKVLLRWLPDSTSMNA